MSTGAVIAIAIGAVLLLAVIGLVGVFVRRRRVETRRERAGELRQEAQARELRATREGAAADEQAARARQSQAQAEEKAAVARREGAEAQQRAEAAEGERRFARDRHEEARSVDPDAVEDEGGRVDDRERAGADRNA